MTMKIILQHIGGVKKEVEVKSASQWLSYKRSGPCLELFWPLAGTYTFRLLDNALHMPKKNSVWSAADINEAWAIWLVMCPGKHRKLIWLVPKEILKSDAVMKAIEFRRREEAA